MMRPWPGKYLGIVMIFNDSRGSRQGAATAVGGGRAHALKQVLKWPFAALFIVGGILHFTNTATYVRLMPSYVPYHRELVYVSGIVETALGLLLLIPRTQRLAAWCLIPTLVAIFPANVNGAVTAGTGQPAMPGVSVELAWLRLPVQFVLVAWAYWYTRPES
jgi:uncharacterized membrane protein